MTIDERLEALTHSVELLTHMQRTNEESLHKAAKQVEKISTAVHQLDESTLVTNRIAERHNQMLADHREWLASHTMAIREHDERMKQLDGKLDRIADLILRSQGGNGHT